MGELIPLIAPLLAKAIAGNPRAAANLKIAEILLRFLSTSNVAVTLNVADLASLVGAVRSELDKLPAPAVQTTPSVPVAPTPAAPTPPPVVIPTPPVILPFPPVLPSRSEVLANLRADICMREDGDTRAYSGNGTWESLSWPDDRWNAFVVAYKAAGNRLLPCSMVVKDYLGVNFDYTVDVPLLKSRLDRAHRDGLIPMLALNTQDGDGAGRDTLSRLPAILSALKGHLAAGFTGWEVIVDGSPSLYSYDEHLRVIQIAREVIPELVIGVEFGSNDSREDPIIFDGRGPLGTPAQYWRDTPASLADVVLLRLPYRIVEDPKRVTMEVGGAVCRLSGLFTIPDKWPGGDLITKDYTDNWKTTYGIGKAVSLFEFGSYLRWPSSKKKLLREFVQSVVPISGYGEG